MIVTLTLNPTIDKSTVVAQVEPEHKLRCENPTYEPGGGGLNVSRAIRNLGETSRAIWSGGGYSGERLQGLLDRESGLDHSRIDIGTETRENLIVFESNSKRQYRFGMPGAAVTNRELEDIHQRIADIEDLTYLVASGSLPPGVPASFLVRLGHLARDRGARYIVDTSGDALRTVLEEAHLFLIKPNLRELCAIVGCEVENEQRLREAGRSLVEDGRVEAVMVSLGAGGARLINSGETINISAPVVPIRSKVGAGDSSVAGVLVGLTRGLNLADAARFGVAAGAAAVMTDGTGLCRREDTERLYEEMKKEAASDASPR